MELQAVSGQISIGGDGTRNTGPIPGLLATSAPGQAARGRQKDFLFVHLTLSGRPEENSVLTHDVVDSISSLFFQTPGSVTAALKKAITQSNQQLLRFNVSGAGTPREGALTCAVLRGEELFLVQVGESFALLGHNFGIERLPPSSPEKITPLGRTAGLDLRYTHNWLQPGDMLLLADPRLAHLPTSAFESSLIDVDAEDGLRALVDIVGDDMARLLLVEFTDEAPGYLPDAQRIERHKTGRQLPPPTANPMREGQPVTGEGPAPGGAPPGPTIDVEVVETQARKATSRAALGLSGIVGWFANLLSSLYSPEDQTRESDGWAVPALLAIVIPIVVAIVVGGVYIQRGNVVRLNEIRTEMSQKLLEARQATDQEQARRLFEEVVALAAEAESLRSGDREFAMLRDSATGALDEMAGVARLQGRRLYDFGAESSLVSITIEDELNAGLYVLDGNNNLVFRHDAAVLDGSDTLPEPETILFAEQVIGSHVVGHLVDTMWRPQGINVARDGLAILDSRGALITYYPNMKDLRAVPLGLASEWVSPVAITSFSERLYVLDPGAKAIWRYFPEGEGFNVAEGQRFVELPEGADLGQVIDFAIVSRDGSIILLYADGRMRQYAGDALLWSEDDLAGLGLTSPMIAPVAVKIVGSGLNSSIFVADPGSDRLLQFSMGGTFLAQYKAIDELGQELFGRAADFAIVENPLRVLVVAGNDLYVASQN